MSCVSNASFVLFAVLFGKWTDHVSSWKLAKLGERILFLTYEEMVQVEHLTLETVLCFNHSLLQHPLN